MLPGFELYYKAMFFKTVWQWHKKRQRSMEQTREYNTLRNPCWCFQLIYEKGNKNILCRKDSFL